LFASALFEIARVLVRFYHVASRVVNANHIAQALKSIGFKEEMLTGIGNSGSIPVI
jgi:hypothetical protein